MRRIQNELFDVGADLATPIVADPPWDPPLRVTQDYIDRLEADCDLLNEELAPLDSFILPGGDAGRRAAAPGAHRRPARRAQRAGRWWRPTRTATNALACTYLNRLSDLLFILARIANPGGDVRWVPGGERNADAPRQRRRSGGAGAADTETA